MVSPESIWLNQLQLIFLKTLSIPKIIVYITTTIIFQSEVLMQNKMCFHVTDHASEVQTFKQKSLMLCSTQKKCLKNVKNLTCNRHLCHTKHVTFSTKIPQNFKVQKLIGKTQSALHNISVLINKCWKIWIFLSGFSKKNTYVTKVKCLNWLDGTITQWCKQKFNLNHCYSKEDKDF